VLCEIGFRAVQLDGGYRAYRRHVVTMLAHMPDTFHYRVVCGLTGSGKSRLIEAIAAEGGQALDLEALARHRGSLLGDLPGAPQPSQKAFETSLYDALTRFDATRPVYVESESRRIGRLQLPEALLGAMRGAPCVRIETPQPLRVSMLADDYVHFVHDDAALSAQIAPLSKLHGNAVIARWQGMIERAELPALAAELLDTHYDPCYRRAIQANFPRFAQAPVLRVTDVSPASFRALARTLLDDPALSRAA
jgi:tRNA 2-selenouridine synthase